MNVENFDKNNKLPLKVVQAGSSSHEPDMPLMNVFEDGNQYVLDCLSDINAMQRIGDEWRALEQNNGEPYIYFQSFDWCYEWCKIFANSDEKPGDENSAIGIKIYILRRNNDLIMVWPMMVTKSKLGFTTQTFLSEPHGQYGNIICDRKLLPLKIGKQIWKHIKENCEADALTLDQYPQSSYLKEIVDGDGLVESSDKHSSILDLTAFDTWEEYRASFSRKLRKQRNQRRNRLTKLGEIGYEIHYGGTQRYNELVTLALQWKRVWLHETGRRATVLSQERTKEFYSQLTGEAGYQGACPTGAIIGTLTLDGKPVAIEIGLCLDGHYYCYLGAFDWELKKFSPGKVQMEETQVWAKDAGIKKFDFLGEPADYKTTWTNSTGELESRSVGITWRGLFYCAIWKAHLRPASRMLFNKLTAENRSKLLGILGIRKASSSGKSDGGSTHKVSKTIAPPLNVYVGDK